MELPLWNTQGNVVGTVQVRDDVFGAPPNEALIHQVVVGQLSNTRVGTASTKTRGEVSGGGRKPRAQKGLGRARQGSIRAPHWKGGGVVFGPRPRSFRHNTPRRMRRLSLISALSDKIRDDQLVVLDSLSLETSKTAEMAGILNAIEAGPSAILVADGVDPSVLKSARNIPRLRMLPAALLNTLDLVKHRKVIMTLDAVRRAEQLWGGLSDRSAQGRASTEAEA